MCGGGLTIIEKINKTIYEIALMLLRDFRSSESLDLPFVWIISTSLNCIWGVRVLGKQARLDVCRAEMSGKLKSTK